MMTKAPASKLSSSEVYELLRRRILEHTLPPATKINIQQLSKELGVSATPVREALRQLQGDNLLVGTSNKGYATTDVLDEKGVRALFEFRLLVEPWAARVAASDSLRNPSGELDREIKAFDPNFDSVRHAMIDHDSKFHLTILGSTENTIVIDAYRRSHCHLHLFRMFGDEWDWRSSLSQHRAIQDAIARCDPDGAEEAMRYHLHQAYRGFAESMPQAPEPGEPRAPSRARMVQTVTP
jgi:DNA-binding GntR family transcriptional regulator